MFAYDKKDSYTFSFTSPDELRKYCEDNGYEIPFSKDLSLLGKELKVSTRAGEKVLKNRLVEISTALLSLKSSDATKILGCPDDLKLKSCMTLFSEISPEIEVFDKVLQKFFSGKKRNLSFL